MTPEAYIAAVKACPRVACLDYGLGKWLWRGYATRLEGDKIEAVPDHALKSKNTTRSYAESSTPDRLWAYGSNGVNPLFVQNVFVGEMPSEEQLRDYFVRKHGKLRGLNWLFPRSIRTRLRWSG